MNFRIIWVVFLFLLFSQFTFILAQDKRSEIIVEFLDEKKSPEVLYKNSYALVIGVTDYTNGWNDLPGVAKDVAEVQQTLKNQKFQVTTLMNPTNETLESGVKKFLDDYGYEYENRLLIYFAGHGHTQKAADRREFGYIVPANAPLPSKDLIEFQKKAVSMDTVQGWAKRAVAKHLLFVFDSCFSGKLISRDNVRIPTFIRENVSSPVRQFITSGSANQTVPDESLFRKFFIRGLDGEADRNQDGYVLASELADYLRENVINYSDGSQTPQYGKIRDIDLDRGDFVFALPKTVQAAANIHPAANTDAKPKFDMAFWQKQKDKAMEKRNAPTGEFSAYGVSEEEIAAKSQLSEKIIERIKAGEDFAKLVQEYSSDEESKTDDGLIKNFEYSSYFYDFEDALPDLKTGEVASVETTGSINIIKLEEKREVKQTDGKLKTEYDVSLIVLNFESTETKSPLIIPAELSNGNIVKQKKKIEELNFAPKMPFDYVGLANLLGTKWLSVVPFVTDDYFLDVGGNVTEAPLTTFDFEKGSTELKANSKEFQVLSNLANNFGGVKYDLNNSVDRKMFKRQLLMTLHPKAVSVLEEIARAYKQKYARPLRVTSMTRSIEYQVGLNANNPDSFKVRDKNTVPPHVTGVAFDLSRKYMTAEEQNFILQKLAEMERAGRIDGLIEYGINACFHIFVYPDGKPPKMQ